MLLVRNLVRWLSCHSIIEERFLHFRCLCWNMLIFLDASSSSDVLSELLSIAIIVVKIIISVAIEARIPLRGPNCHIA